MIKATCGICKSEFQKDKEDGPGCPVCGFGMEQKGLQYVPYPVPYPVYPQPYHPWSPFEYPLTVTNDRTIPNTTKITWVPGVVSTSTTFKV